VAVSTLAAGRALLALETQQPVDCCAAVYDPILAAETAGFMDRIDERWWLAGWLCGGLAVSGLGLAGWLRGRGARFLPLAALLWVPLAAGALVRSLAAYHYGVLQHHCPWCLFLADYRSVGYPLALALAVVAGEGLAIAVVGRHASRRPALAAAAARRVRLASLRAALAAGAFLALSGGPALWWRLRYGTWL
jgi:hypothetical protein